MGFPIRKFLDQSLFAAPQDLSQRTTSFIASQHQGIHRIPLSHLIDLIIHTGLRKAQTQRGETHTHKPPQDLGDPGWSHKTGHKPGLKTSLLQLYPQGCLPWAEAKAKAPRLRSSTTVIRSGSKRPTTKPKPVLKHPDPELAVPKNGNRIESLFTMLNHSAMRSKAASGIRHPEGFYGRYQTWQRLNPLGEAPTTIMCGSSWWSLTGSNRRHPACKAGALPAELRPQTR